MGFWQTLKTELFHPFVPVSGSTVRGRRGEGAKGKGRRGEGGGGE